GEPPRPIGDLPEYGKIPGTDDERPMGAALELLGFMRAPGTGFLARSAASMARGMAQKMLASRSANLYNPPAKAPRAFTEDYPNVAPADPTGRLIRTIDGDG